MTFDSGGISIKPAENMHEMKYDMSGGAGVIAAMCAIGELKPKVNVIGIVPASENLPGPRAMKPGDVLRAMNGKTIEVINTDAEGRLILADGLCYARELGATQIVDCATLTGACVVALGHAASGTMSNDDEFVQHFLRVAKTTGERYWQLPLYDDYSKAVKSEIADLRNSTGRAAGSDDGRRVPPELRRRGPVDPSGYRRHRVPRRPRRRTWRRARRARPCARSSRSRKTSGATSTATARPTVNGKRRRRARSTRRGSLAGGARLPLGLPVARAGLGEDGSRCDGGVPLGAVGIFAGEAA